MTFIDPELSTIIESLHKLKEVDKPLWGKMSAQRMIEHLSDTVKLGITPHNYRLTIPEDKVEKAQAFLLSQHPMPKNFQVEFATETTPLRNNNLQEAIIEFNQAWKDFETYFESNSTKNTLHPNFGNLDYRLWKRLHSKHITHHLSQFGLNE